jgi:hypothetical protein
VIAGDEATFITNWFGKFTLILNGTVFKSKSPDLSFCGINSVLSEVPPDGCGFSGRWALQTNTYFPGSYMILKQTEEQVRGTVYDQDGQFVDSIFGSVLWGKGWRMQGQSSRYGWLVLNITSSETGLEYSANNADPASNQCAVRAGTSKGLHLFILVRALS